MGGKTGRQKSLSACQDARRVPAGPEATSAPGPAPPHYAELVAALPRPSDEEFYEHLLGYDEDPDPTPESDRELVHTFLRRYDHGSDE